jgi:hypothetical protein
MQIVVLALGSGDDKMRGRRVQEQTLDKTNLRGLLGQVDVVNVLGAVEIKSQAATKSEDISKRSWTRWTSKTGSEGSKVSGRLLAAAA